ncbi:MAG: hypothetical protein ACRD0K_28945 [Egibacteraceae bacterium]
MTGELDVEDLDSKSARRNRAAAALAELVGRFGPDELAEPGRLGSLRSLLGDQLGADAVT